MRCYSARLEEWLLMRLYMTLSRVDLWLGPAIGGYAQNDFLRSLAVRMGDSDAKCAVAERP